MPGHMHKVLSWFIKPVFPATINPIEFFLTLPLFWAENYCELFCMIPHSDPHICCLSLFIYIFLYFSDLVPCKNLVDVNWWDSQVWIPWTLILLTTVKILTDLLSDVKPVNVVLFNILVLVEIQELLLE